MPQCATAAGLLSALQLLHDGLLHLDHARHGLDVMNAVQRTLRVEVRVLQPRLHRATPADASHALQQLAERPASDIDEPALEVRVGAVELGREVVHWQRCAEVVLAHGRHSHALMAGPHALRAVVGEVSTMLVRVVGHRRHAAQQIQHHQTHGELVHGLPRIVAHTLRTKRREREFGSLVRLLGSCWCRSGHLRRVRLLCLCGLAARNVLHPPRLLELVGAALRPQVGIQLTSGLACAIVVQQQTGVEVDDDQASTRRVIVHMLRPEEARTEAIHQQRALRDRCAGCRGLDGIHGSAHHVPDGSHPLQSIVARHPRVDGGRREENVVELEVAVDDAPPVQLLHTPGQLQTPAETIVEHCMVVQLLVVQLVVGRSVVHMLAREHGIGRRRDWLAFRRRCRLVLPLPVTFRQRLQDAPQRQSTHPLHHHDGLHGTAEDGIRCSGCHDCPRRCCRACRRCRRGPRPPVRRVPRLPSRARLHEQVGHTKHARQVRTALVALQMLQHRQLHRHMAEVIVATTATTALATRRTTLGDRVALLVHTLLHRERLDPVHILDQLPHARCQLKSTHTGRAAASGSGSGSGSSGRGWHAGWVLGGRIDGHQRGHTARRQRARLTVTLQTHTVHHPATRQAHGGQARHHRARGSSCRRITARGVLQCRHRPALPMLGECATTRVRLRIRELAVEPVDCARQLRHHVEEVLLDCFCRVELLAE